MNFEQLIREEQCHLKNQITQLKNAFDINRDILSILIKHDVKNDPQHSIFLKIISKLTSINNQAMMSTIQLIQQKNTLKAEIYRLNVELNRLEQRLNAEIQNSKLINSPTEAKLFLHDQFNKVNRQLLAYHEEKIQYEQQIAFWKDNCIRKQQNEIEDNCEEMPDVSLIKKKSRIKRKYTSNQIVKNDWLVYQLQRQNRKLKKVIEQLQSRVDILVQAHNLQQTATRRRKESARYKFQWQNELQQVALLKYALNAFSIKQKKDGLYLTITHRFRQHLDPQKKRNRKVHSWPKHKQFKYQIADEEHLANFVEKTLKTDEDSK